MALALFLCPVQALAGSAGGDSIPCAAVEQVRYVEDDNDNGFRDSGENTDCTTPVFDGTDPNNPLIRNGAGGTVCLPAVDAQLRGTLTVIADDDAKDNDSGNTGETFTLVIEVRHQDEIFRVANSYTATSLGNLNLGNWDERINSEANAFGIQFAGALFLTPAGVTDGAFDAMGAELTQFAETRGLIADKDDYLPIIANATRDAERKRFVQNSTPACGDPDFSVPTGCGELESDESGAADSLASIAVYRLTIGFAEELTGSPPSCS
jgi:hypothetical protein